MTSEGDERHIRLRWPAAGEGRRYRVQISDESDFKTTSEDRILETPAWESERPLMPSYFRVRTIDIDGYEGAWSTPQMIDPVRQPWYIYVLPPALLLLLAL